MCLQKKITYELQAGNPDFCLQGSLEHILLLDDFVLAHMATADINYFEGYPGMDCKNFFYKITKIL